MPRSLLALLLAACGTSPIGSNTDRDGDGYPVPQDCDDTDPTVHPTAADAPYDGVDSNCLGDDDFDVDYDGYPFGEDCDDRNRDVHPGADEICDGLDQNCNNVVDEDAVDGISVYPDGDGDGFGATGAPPVIGCATLTGWSEVNTDCDDERPERYPGNPEVCDSLDNNCDGQVDEGVFDYTSWPDLDEDGFGDENAEPAQTCFEVPVGFVLNALDCDDASADTYNGAPDVLCDLEDNDCDPSTSEPGAVWVDGVLAPSLGDALASAPNGAALELCEGTYDGNVSIVRGTTLIGAGSALTVIDGLAAGPALAVDTADLVTLSGLTLTNGIGRNDGSGNHQGGGLWVQDGGRVEGTDLVIAFNRAGDGGGVWLGENSSLWMEGGSISDNTGDFLLSWSIPIGGGLYVYPNSTVSLVDVAIERNTAEACGGMKLLFDGTVVSGGGTTSVRNNEALGLSGGGICADWGATLSDLDIVDNVAAISGGGIDGGTPLVLTNVRLEGNEASLGGGGVSLSSLGSFDASAFTDCVIIDNNAGISGGGVETSAVLTITNSEVSNNNESFFATYGGGAELTGYATLTSVNTLWVANLDHDVGMGDDSFVAGVRTDFVCTAATGQCQ